MFLPNVVSLVFAQSEAATLVPIGTVTGMLVAIFIWFIKAAANQNKRIDENNQQVINATFAERDRAFAERDKAYAERDKALIEKENMEIIHRREIEEKQARFDRITQSKDHKIRELEIENLRYRLSNRGV